MSSSQTPLNPRVFGKGIWLGLALLAGFLIVGAALWALGSGMGLGTASSFLLAACVAPILVGGAALLWILILPPERRQALLGVSTAKPHDEEKS